MDLEIIKNIDDLFSLFQNHSRFFIRERLYKGSPSLGGGLAPVHEQMKSLIEKTKLHPIPEFYLQIKKDEFERHVGKLTKTLDMLLFVSQKEDINPEEFTKMISIIEMEIVDLDEYLIKGHSFDPNSIKSYKEKSISQIDDLKLKI